MMAAGKLAVQVALVALVTQVATSVPGVRSELSREGLLPPAAGSAAKTPAAPGSAKKATAQAPARKVAAGKSSSYAFETVNSRGEPARWNTCAVIPITVDTRGAPAGAMSDLRTALARVNAATGLRFTITATANRALTAHNSDNPTRPVVIGFADGRSGVFSDANTAGLTSVAVAPDTNTSVGATVVFNLDLLGTYSPGSTGPDPMSALFLHELGHLAGLDHVNDPTQIMFTDTGHARVFGAGDLAGLHALATPGCAPGK